MKFLILFSLIVNVAFANDVQSSFSSNSKLPTDMRGMVLREIMAQVPCLAGYSLKEIITEEKVERFDQLIDIYYVTHFNFNYYDGPHPVKSQMSVYSEDKAGNCNGPCLSVSKVDAPKGICK